MYRTEKNYFITVIFFTQVLSILLIKVFQKTKDIGVLRSLGASSNFILRLFLAEGMLLGGLGIGIGATLGTILSFLIEKYHLVSLPQDIYYLRYLPAKTQVQDILLIVGFSFILVFLSSLFPAIKAKDIQVSSCLRYE